MYSLTALRYAEATARLQSFSAAARECGVSQPTVSSAVADLEAALEAVLFLRGGRQLVLSQAGGRLLPRIRAVLEAAELLRAETTALASTARSELRIGFTPLVGAGRLALLLEPYSRANAETRLVFFESSVSDLEQRLDAGQLDVIIGCGFRRLRSRRRVQLLRDPLVLCVPTGTAAASGTASLLDASGARLLFTEDLCGLATATRALFAEAGLSVDAYPGRAMSYGALEDWVELGLGQAVMPACHVRNRALARSLIDAEGKPLALDLEATWRPSLAAAPYATQFLAHLHRVVPILARGLGSSQSATPSSVQLR